MTDLLTATGQKLFSQFAIPTPDPRQAYRSAPDQWPHELWTAIADAGMPFALLSEAQGGFGFSAHDVLRLIGAAANFNMPVPLGETLLANYLFASCGLPTSAQPATVASGLHIAHQGGSWRISGEAHRVPYARHAGRIAVLTNDANGADYLALLDSFKLGETSHNLAGEARDSIKTDALVTSVSRLPFPGDRIAALGALLRAAAMAGALEAILERSVHYANERQQFGRPIAKFQAIQHYLATMAGEVAAARMAVDMAAAVFPETGTELTHSQDFVLKVSAAKVRTGEASGTIAKLAHQIHGAIGFSWEYSLHPLTRRVLSWREEFGNESYWSGQIGQYLLEQGPDSLWPSLTDGIPA